MAILYAVRNRLVEGPKKEPQFVQVKRVGTKYDLGGAGIVELFRIKILAEALDRTVLVLKQWERLNEIPKPLYQIEGDQCLHWYSAAQVINCHRLMMGRYKGRKYLPAEELITFRKDVKRIWNARDIVVNENGTLLQETG